MCWVANVCYLVAALLYAPVALYNALVRGKNRHGWRQRFGFVPTFEKDRMRIWIHAVSLGEINATPRLVDALRAKVPNTDIVISTTTDTGYARAVKLYGADRVFRFPLDFSWVISRVLQRVKPNLIVLVELEVWYNLVRLATRRDIPLAVVNGRLTQRSAQRLSWLGGAGRSMFQNLRWVGAQDEVIASRFHELGVAKANLTVTSSLKWDSAQATDKVDGAETLADAIGLDRSRPLWVCGSTGPGEEAMILKAYRKLVDDWPIVAQGMQAGLADGANTATPTLAIVPRKPERFDEVARLIERAGFSCIRRSERADGAPPAECRESAVCLGDTMGELRKFYSLADVVLVGRTLVAMGGSDPMEVAALAKPIVVGPHTDNFDLPVRAFRDADAIRTVDSSDALPKVVAAILQDPASAVELGKRAREVVRKHQGATERTASAICEILATA